MLPGPAPTYYRRPLAMPQAGDLAPGFLAERGQCWRMVYGSANVGQGTHCTEGVVWRGRLTNAGKSWEVWACRRHAAELEDIRRVGHITEPSLERQHPLTGARPHQEAVPRPGQGPRVSAVAAIGNVEGAEDDMAAVPGDIR
jgi:hypothetical protein